MKLILAAMLALYIGNQASGTALPDEHGKSWQDLEKKLQDPMDLLYGFHKRGGVPSLAELEAAENSMSLSLYSCEVQKSVLARLRDLVIMSIAQVKSCMAQREADSKSKYSYLVKGGESPIKSIQDFDNRLLTI